MTLLPADAVASVNPAALLELTGVALERYQIDVGIDLPESIDTASLSMIFRF